MEHWEDKMTIGLEVVKTCKLYTCRLYWWGVYQKKNSNSWTLVFFHPKILCLNYNGNYFKST